MSDDSKKAYHNEGQRDASEGKFNPPHGVLDSLLTWSDSGMNQNAEENAAYNQGHSSTEGQRDGSNNTYNPPPSDMGKEAYDKAWNEGFKNRK